MLHNRIFTKTYMAAFALLLLSATVYPALLHVPAEYSSIQGGIDGANDGDTVLVADGHYFERIDLRGKDIVVSSEILLDGDTSHVSATLIDASQSGSGSVVTAIGDVGTIAHAILRGFTILNGSSDQGGGIFIRRYDLTVRDCALRDNYADDGGVAFLRSRAFVIFESCEIHGDSESIETYYTIGLFGECNLIDCDIYDTRIDLVVNLNIIDSRLDSCPVEFWTYSFTTVSNSEFSDCSFYARDESSLDIDSSMLLNTSIETQSSGVEINSSLVEGAVMIHDDMGSYLNAESTTFVGGIGIEQGDGSKGGSDVRSAAISLDRCIVYVESGHAVACPGDNTYLSFTCCDIYTPDGVWLQGIPDGIDTSDVFFNDPIFCNPGAGEYGLAADSPCLPENNDCAELIGALPNSCPPLLICGDVNGSGEVDLADIQFLFIYLIADGPEPYPYWKADTNCSGLVDIDDAVYLISYLFGGGSEPCANCQ